MMNAKQAREKVEQAINAGQLKEQKEIEAAILEAISVAKTMITVVSLSGTTEEWLKSHGYTVSYQYCRNEGWHEIKW